MMRISEWSSDVCSSDLEGWKACDLRQCAPLHAATNAMPDILVLYYSRGGSVARLARHVARGIGEVEGMSARLRTVPPVAVATQVAAPPIPEDGAPYVQPADLDECAGLVLGSPTRFGNMAAPVKHFIDGLGAQSASGTQIGRAHV